MTVDVATEMVIGRSRETVAAFSADPDKAPEWYVNIKSVEWVTPPALQVGAKIAFVASFLGRRLAYTYEIVELDLPNRLMMRTAQGPFPMETSYEWCEAGANSTRMILRNRGEPSGFQGFWPRSWPAPCARQTSRTWRR